ncbi:MAG TPA: purine-nucleoside phosphorylase [Polyangiales bacterium]|nr:purine-nucleoside phosphorylase [Polyangiales bacterium]
MTHVLAADRLEGALRALRSTQREPRVALVLGSGLGAFADTLSDIVRVPYTQLEGMPRSAVPGHAGNFVLGRSAEREVIAMQGRVHMYEGYSAEQVVMGVRLMVSLGARTLIVTNAAGGIRDSSKPGRLMLIEDHLNLTGHNCLAGPNDARLGPRFPDLSDAYDPELRSLAAGVAGRLGIAVERGIYAGLLGPNYETPAEIRMLATLGAHAVGMSTVQEVIAARHMGARVLGISCITNLAAGLSPHKLSHAEVEATALATRAEFSRLLAGVIAELPV